MWSTTEVISLPVTTDVSREPDAFDICSVIVCNPSLGIRIILGTDFSDSIVGGSRGRDLPRWRDDAYLFGDNDGDRMRFAPEPKL